MSMTPLPPLDNRGIATRLRQAAEILAVQGANPYRVAAYRKAAQTIESLAESIGSLYEREGHEGLEALPAIGVRIAAALAEMLSTGRWSELDRLRGSLDPEALLRTVPGIGATLARRIHDEIGADSLEALELACHDGTLDRMPGVGERRTAGIRAAVAEMLQRLRPPRRDGSPPASDPPVDVLLDVDREYREKAARRELPTIAPARFNPAHVSWLPVLHTERGDWHFTALFSNTARAHELGRTRDWVVLYFDGDRQAERRCTIVTEHQRGALAGRRVVRGREAECRAHYAASTAAVDEVA
jgi:hypothetical protein